MNFWLNNEPPPFPAFLTAGALMAVSPILVILGPTASGKSALASALAHRFSAEILSVDSMQVYRCMNVGTAKASIAELAEITHHLVDVVDPHESFTAARFVELADSTIRRAQQRNIPLIATGGTPLYYKALFQGMFEGPSADATVRDRLRAMSNDELHRRLTQVDPDAAQRIHVNDTKRLIRALEVHELTGRPISTLQQQWSTGGARHHAVWIGLHWERDALNRRINARVKEMIAAGWLDETRSLLDRFGELSKTASEATGYAELIAHLHGKISLDEAIEQIKIATRQLARRQMKWLRRFPDVHWIAGDLPLQEQITQVARLWRGDSQSP